MAGEQLRTREREAPTRPSEGALYERVYAARNGFVQRQFGGRLVVKGSQAPVDDGRQGLATFYLSPEVAPDTALQDWLVFINTIRVHSGKHIHQGGICLYVLDGQGYTVVDGERLDWKAGDLITLPLKRGGCEHQHFNAEPGMTCRWMAFINLPQHDQVASGLKQVETSAEYRKLSGGADGGPDLGAVYNPTREVNGWPSDSFGIAPRVTKGFNGYAGLIERRNAERARLAQTQFIIDGSVLPWEVNPHGVMQWYMHPDLEWSPVRSYLFYRQLIPAGSRSGRQRHQGGKVFFILEGRGQTRIDGVAHDWEAGDLVQLPLRPDGVIYQHVNLDREQPVRLLACEPNAMEALGVDRGSGFVQLENCPEYDSGLEDAPA